MSKWNIQTASESIVAMANLQSSEIIDTLREITSIYRSLPPRPSMEEVEAAFSILKTANNEEQMKLEEIFKQEIPRDLPEELFSVLQHMVRNGISLRNDEQKKDALQLLELSQMFQTLDDFIQRDPQLVSGDAHDQNVFDLGISVEKTQVYVADCSLTNKDEKEGSERCSDTLKMVNCSPANPSVSLSPGDGEKEKSSLIEVAALIENFARSGHAVVDLKGKLADKVEWLPLSIGKLSALTELNLSENRIMALPTSIGGLKSMTRLDLHSNQIINLPATFGELINLADLDLHANRLRSLPESFRNLTHLVNLDLSSNEFRHLPDLVGNLACLKRLNIETNELEELPHSIGSCFALLELKLDFNRLNALPDGIGKLEGLEILTLHYNRIKQLPTTMGQLGNLIELDVSFNEIESIPENLCFATNLKKLNVGKNFSDLRTLPRSLGNFQMLEELDISCDQIRVLPDSFSLLSKLRIFLADETPLDVPPKEVANLGAQAVVEYMADLVANKDAKLLPSTKRNKGLFFWLCSIFCLCFE